MISILCGNSDFVQRQLSTDPSPGLMLFGDGAMLCRRDVRFDEAFVILNLPLLIYIKRGLVLADKNRPRHAGGDRAAE